MADSGDSQRDWRLDLGPENLFDTTLVKKRYRAWSEDWEHEHCVYCTAKFMDPLFSDLVAQQIKETPEILTVGFVVQHASPGGKPDSQWVCETCAQDFCELFRWSLVASEPLPESAVKPDFDD